MASIVHILKFWILKIHLKTVFITTIAVIVILSHFPWRFAKRNYSFIAKSAILSELVTNTTTFNSRLKLCDYQTVLEDAEFLDLSDILNYKLGDLKDVKKGGEYTPKDCQPKFSVAIIIPFRSRYDQLDIFLSYFHRLLQQQKLHYQIFVVNQSNDKLFNRAKLFNAGAIVAMSKKFPCLILHDIDLIPLNTGNIYACTKRPRHMSSNLNTFRFTLPYEGLFGGAVSILATQFKQINGLSNIFDGWGGEDDNFFERLKAHNLLPTRFDPETSQYFMLKHKKQPKSYERFNILKESLRFMDTDGLNSFDAVYNISYLDLYTMINVFR